MSSNFDNITKKISTCVTQDTLVGNTEYFLTCIMSNVIRLGESAMWVASIEEFLDKLNRPHNYLSHDVPNKIDTRVFTSLSDAEEYHNQQLREEEANA